MIIVGPAFSGKFTDPIGTAGIGDRVLGCILMGCVRTENSNGTRPEHFVHFFFFGQIKDIALALHVQPPGKYWIIFCFG